MFSRELDKIKRNVIMTSIVLMFAGMLLLIVPPECIPYLNDALCFGLMVTSVVTMFIFIGSPKVLIRYIQLCIGLSVGIIGIALWIFDEMFLTMLIWLIGIATAVAGVPGIFHAFAYARRSGRKGWWILVVFSILIMLFGVFIIWNPWLRSESVAMMVAGFVLMGSSFVSALRLIWLRPVK